MSRDNRYLYMAHVGFYVCCSDCVGACGNVCCVSALLKIVFLRLVVLESVVCLCKGCDGCCFCLYCDVWSCRCSCMGSMSVSSCRCCMFVSCVPPVAVLNATFGITFSLLILVEDARGDHMSKAYSRAGLVTALYVTMGVFFCLPHPVSVSAFIICSGLCACTEML